MKFKYVTLATGMVVAMTLQGWSYCHDPAEAAKSFLVAVAADRHREAWNLMTVHSQQFCIVLVANQRHVRLSEAEAMLDRDDAGLAAFWQRVKITSRADDYSHRDFTSGSIVGNKGVAFAGGLTNHVTLYAYKSRDGWKFDYPESFGLK